MPPLQTRANVSHSTEDEPAGILAIIQAAQTEAAAQGASGIADLLDLDFTLGNDTSGVHGSLMDLMSGMGQQAQNSSPLPSSSKTPILAPSSLTYTSSPIPAPQDPMSLLSDIFGGAPAAPARTPSQPPALDDFGGGWTGVPVSTRPFVPLQPFRMPKTTWLTASKGSGLEVQGTFSHYAGKRWMELTLINSNAQGALNNFAVQFNKNS